MNDEVIALVEKYTASRASGHLNDGVWAMENKIRALEASAADKHETRTELWQETAALAARSAEQEAALKKIIKSAVEEAIKELRLG